MNAPAIIIFTTGASQTAAKIADSVGGRVHACGPMGEGAKELLPRLFHEGTPIIGICAAGILIRLLAPHLNDKHAEPPVIAISADGQDIVPLLGGHRGANRLARELAHVLDGRAAITTASDTMFSRALDEPPHGFVLGTPELAKKAMAAMLNGESLSITGDGDAQWVRNAGYAVSRDGEIELEITPKMPRENVLTYHPKSVIAGVGCARGTGADEIVELVQSCLKEANIAPAALVALASIDIKSDEVGMSEAAARLGVPVRFFPAHELAEEEPRLVTPSEVVRQETGTPGVCEAAAIKAGELILAKRKTANATCALGMAQQPLDPEWYGFPRGELHIIGIGPGEQSQRTLSAIHALQNTWDWVGYGLYLDLVADLKTHQTEHRFDLGDEEMRVRHALELAAKGRRVSLVCSGDGQIYAMAALVFELLQAEGARAVSAAAHRVVVESHPGISAFQMASARVGALIGHDFCCISLSDLLTPREDILLRLDGAARSGFVTAFYNPRSKRRIDLLDKAKEVFLAHRPADCPVIVASNLGREKEKVTVTTLAKFDPSEVDMLTIVLFGAPQSKSFTEHGEVLTYTPRGYAKKAEGQS